MDKWNKMVTAGLSCAAAIAGFHFAFGYFPGFAPKAPAKLKLGVVVPLIGDNSMITVLRAAELAKKELGADDVEIAYRDSNCDEKLAVQYFNELADEGADVVLGGCTTKPLIPVAAERQIPLISPSATPVSYSVAGDFFLRTAPADDMQAKYTAALMKNEKRKKVAVIFSNDAYGQGLDVKIGEELRKRDVQVVARFGFDKGAPDLGPQIERVLAAVPDAVYVVSGYTADGAAVIREVRKRSADVALYASETLFDTSVLDRAGAAAEGMTVVSIALGSDDFRLSYRLAYGADPEVYGAQSFDAFVAAYKAFKTGARGGVAIRDAILATEFDGVSSHIKFDEKGDMVGGGYETYKVKGGKFKMAN